MKTWISKIFILLFKAPLFLVLKFDALASAGRLPSYHNLMHIEFIFFGIYLLACFYFFPRLPFTKKAALGKTKVGILLAFKLLFALACAYYINSFVPSDYLGYNDAGREQYGLLLSNPLLFFTDAGAGSENYGGFFDASDSFWANLRFSLLYKFIAILNLLTAGNFYLNSVVFSSLVFLAHIAFYRIYSDMYPNHKNTSLVICFLLPSILMYTACVHKDGLVFLLQG